MNQPPPFRKPGSSPVHDIAEEGMQSVGKAVRGVWDFLTADDDKAFLQKFDADNGTKFGELYARVKLGPAKDELRPAIDAVGVEVGKVTATASDDEVVIVVEEDKPCDFCRGKQVIALKGASRTPIACPTCRKNPAGERADAKKPMLQSKKGDSRGE